MTRRYRAAPTAAIRAVRLDAMTAVYHRSAGITHLLGAPAPEILAALASGPMTAADLLDRLEQTYDLTDRDPARLADRIEELVGIGLLTTE